MPAPYSKMADVVNKEALAKGRMSLLSRREISLNGVGKKAP
jgi:hypothetical protein